MPVLYRTGEDVPLSPIPLKRGVFALGSLAGDLHGQYVEIAGRGVQDRSSSFPEAPPPWFAELVNRESSGLLLSNFAPQLNPNPSALRSIIDPVERSFSALADLGWVGAGLALALFVIWGD